MTVWPWLSRKESRQSVCSELCGPYGGRAPMVPTTLGSRTSSNIWLQAHYGAVRMFLGFAFISFSFSVPHIWGKTSFVFGECVYFFFLFLLTSRLLPMMMAMMLTLPPGMSQRMLKRRMMQGRVAKRVVVQKGLQMMTWRVMLRVITGQWRAMLRVQVSAGSVMKTK